MSEMIQMVIEVMRDNLWAVFALGAVLGICVSVYVGKVIVINRESDWQDEQSDEYWAARWERM